VEASSISEQVGSASDFIESSVECAYLFSLKFKQWTTDYPLMNNLR